METDHLATPRLITNASRQKRWTWESAPYGDTFPNENPQALGAYNYNLRFPGQYFDSETNHHYNHHRDYESTTGRYVQSDPIGLAGGLNSYLYVGGNPILYADPSGLMAPAIAACLASPPCVALFATTIGAIGWGMQGTVDAINSSSSNSGGGTCDPCNNLAGPSSTPPFDLCALFPELCANGQPNYDQTVSLDPNTIRFSQSSASGLFRNGQPVQDLVTGLRSGAVSPADVPPIQVTVRNGQLFTLDNRRLWAFQQANLPIRCRLISAEKAALQSWKFTTTNNGNSITIRGIK